MAQRLIQVAKELNVGLGSLVEHLHKKGFDIDGKPTSMVDEDMLAELYREFQKSAAIKEEADKISFGIGRPTPPPVTPEPPKPVVATPEPKEEKPEEPKPKVIKPNIEDYKPQLKVVGKIDLEPKKTEKTEKEKPTVPEPKAVEEVKPPVEIQPEKTESATVPTPAVEPVPEQDDVIRAEAPTLKGLKILGKIDTDKFTSPANKRKEAAKDKPENKPNPSQAPNNSADDKKKKRKRKKVQQPPGITDKNTVGANKNKAPETPKEVSKKEIDDKIKATMARLSAGGKKKRQKIRRDKRETFREKQEMLELENANEKLQLTEFVTVSELASLLDVPFTEVITTCMNLGVIVSINQRLDAEIIELVANEFQIELDGTSLVKSSAGLKVNTLSGWTGAQKKTGSFTVASAGAFTQTVSVSPYSADSNILVQCRDANDEVISVAIDTTLSGGNITISGYAPTSSYVIKYILIA